MSERGVFAVDRGIWNHPVLSSREPFTRREAWIWLISEAAWKVRRRRVGLAMIEIARGEVAHSIRFLAEAWGWPKSTVARFLDALKTDTMIGTRTERGLTVITIRNYDEYQRVSLPDRDENGTSSGTQTGQQRDTDGTATGHDRDELEDIKNIKQDIAHPPDARSSDSPDGKHTVGSTNKLAIAQAWDAWWRLYPLKKSKGGARKIFERLLTGYFAGKPGLPSPEELLAGVRRYHLECIGKDPKFIKHPTTWLNNGCWADEPTPSASARGEVHSAPPDWDAMMRQYIAAPAHSRVWYGRGPGPDEPDCEVPWDILQKFGFGRLPPSTNDSPLEAA